MKRRLAAILAADVVGYSKLMASDEEGTLAKLSQAVRRVIEPLIDRHGGRVVKLMGDGILAACYAQLGRMEEARHAAKLFEEGRPADSNFSFYASAHARLCKNREDADHWLEGYRKAGLID